MKKYQQGDVVLIAINLEEFEYSKKNDGVEQIRSKNKRHELAYGEETGHCHAIYFEDLLDEAGVTVYKSRWGKEDAPARLVHFKEDVTIKHEEHNPITVPSGFYRQRIVQEYNPFTGRIDGVAD